MLGRRHVLLQIAVPASANCDGNPKIVSALRRLQKMPHIVRAFFADPDLRYITA